MAYGDLYYEKDRSILFGPAVNEAYQMESKVAIYPRIAITPFVAETLIDNWNRIVLEMDNPKTDHDKQVYSLLGNVKRQQGCSVKKDFDGTYMMHYLNSIEKCIGVSLYTHMSNCEFLNLCTELCQSQIEAHREKHHIVQKYRWLLEYINSLQFDSFCG